MTERLGRNLPNEKTAAIMECIKAYSTDTGVPPTLRDIRDVCQISSIGVVKYHLLHLRDAGKLTWQAGMARTLRLVGTAEPWLIAIYRNGHADYTTHSGMNSASGRLMFHPDPVEAKERAGLDTKP